MRFRVTPLLHPRYLELQKRSASLARLWEFGHAVFVVFLSLAIVSPVAVALVPLIDRDFPWARAWSAGVASSAACGLFAAAGFAIRVYARRKGEP
jgi:hypothetical protein